MADPTENPLLSSKPSDTGLFVSLHPLVLLTVSDHVTRHSVRKQKGPIAGALLGQQKGREITAEYAFATDLVQNAEGQWLFNAAWMEERVQQCKWIHVKLPLITHLMLLQIETSTKLLRWTSSAGTLYSLNLVHHLRLLPCNDKPSPS